MIVVMQLIAMLLACGYGLIAMTNVERKVAWQQRAGAAEAYAAEAAVAVKAYARDVLGLRRIVAIALPSNTRSIRMLDRIGFTFERTVRVAANEPELSLLAAPLHRSGEAGSSG